MSSACVDVGVMWRLSEDFNRRFAAARVQQQHQHNHHQQPHSLPVHHHRPISMIYNGNIYVTHRVLTTPGIIIQPHLIPNLKPND